MTERPVILVVDAVKEASRQLGRILHAAGFDILMAYTGKAALETVASNKPAAVILDLDLPDMEGKAVIKTLRQWSSLPVIAVAGRPEGQETTDCLDAGASDYVPKSYSPTILLTRLSAALKYAPERRAEAPRLINGPIHLDLIKQKVFTQNREMKLTKREFALLRCFMRNPGRMLTHQTLLREIWGETHVEDTQYLRVYIGRLRQKLSARGVTGPIIISGSGIGYRMENLPGS